MIQINGAEKHQVRRLGNYVWARGYLNACVPRADVIPKGGKKNLAKILPRDHIPRETLCCDLAEQNSSICVPRDAAPDHDSEVWYSISKSPPPQPNNNSPKHPVNAFFR